MARLPAWSGFADNDNDGWLRDARNWRVISQPTYTVSGGSVGESDDLQIFGLSNFKQSGYEAGDDPVAG